MARRRPLLGHVARARQLAHEAAGEGVTGTRRVEDLFERKRRHGEHRVGGELNHPVLAALDEHPLRTHRQQPPRRLDDVALAAQQPRLFVVDDQNADAPEQLLQRAARLADPMVHRVAPDDAGRRQLVEHHGLQLRIDVGQEDVLRIAMTRRQLRLEIGEDVELQVQRVALVHVLVIAPGPRAGEPAAPLQAGQIDAALREELDLVLRKVLADRRHHLHRREEARGHRKVGRRATQGAIDFAMRGFDGIKEDRSDD